MRPPAFISLAAVALGVTALVAPPAQADATAFTLAWGADGTLLVTAGAGIATTAESEFSLTASTPRSVELRLIDWPTASTAFSSLADCSPLPDNPAFGVLCFWKPGRPAPLTVSLDFAAAKVATTTAVVNTANVPQLTFLGGSGPDDVYGGAGNDEIYGGGGDDNLFGGAGDDKVGGDEGNDDVWGEEGNDSVGGGSGNDYVSGDEGVDSMTGGPGVDTIDSEDGIRDTYVNCDNAPGLGKITYDVGKDWPYDCPVTLAPTVPTIVNASAGSSSFTVDWTAPEFDGNSTITSYELRYQRPGSSTWTDLDRKIDGAESSATVTGLTMTGLYNVSLRAVNAVGFSNWATSVPIMVGARPEAPRDVQSIFFDKWKADVSWAPPSDVTSDTTYELAVRTRNTRDTAWLAWTNLPERTKKTLISVGDDVRLLKDRLYQYRVRVVSSSGSPSAWATSPVRFAGDLEPLTDGKITYDAKAKAYTASLTMAGKAWRYNVEIASMTASLTSGSYVAINWSLVTPLSGNRYSFTFPGPITVKPCWVGVSMKLPQESKWDLKTIPAACPK